MKSAEDRKIEKELENKKKIAEALVAIDEAISNFEAYARSLDAEIDEAALNGDDDLSDELVECQAMVEDIARDFKYIRTTIRSMANMTVALASVQKLPAYLKSCGKILSGVPNLRNLSKDLGTLKRNLDKARGSLKTMRDDIRMGKGKRYNDLFTGNRASDADTLKRCKERREARLAARLGVGVTNPVAATATTPTPATNTASAGTGGNGGTPSDDGAGVGAGINDLLGMMGDVNNGGSGTV